MTLLDYMIIIGSIIIGGLFYGLALYYLMKYQQNNTKQEKAE